MREFRGQVFQSLSFRLEDPAAFADAKRALEADKRAEVDAHRESQFYADQSQLMGSILETLAILITSIMAVAVLLTLGFHPRSVLASFLAASAIIAAVGGIIGCLIALR